jgi:two-component system cell cycle sensor histidine kinase/response regulator CckA
LIAVANRPGGYTGEEARSLETMSQATGVLYDNYRQNLKRVQLEEQRAHLESEFRQSQKMEVLGQLAGGIAHDFNNTLMMLSGATELLEQSLPANSAAMRYLERMRHTTERAAAITRQLLAFSRKQVLEAKPIDLHEVLTDCEFMLPRLIGSDVELTFQHNAARSWIRADGAQVEQVVANLAINARDAMPSGGKLTISTRNAEALPEGPGRRDTGKEAKDWVVLEVKDTGCGMDENTRSHIFEPFFTTKPRGKGAGLGLPTVYGIVHQFEGHILVDSRPGAGTTFQLYFPAHAPAAAAAAAMAPATSAETTPKGRECQLTVLLVDDEPSLRGAGHCVLESHSSLEALEAARTHSGRIDVLLTDIVMPGLRGTELARQVEGIHPGIRVIYMSGYAEGLPEAQIPPNAAFLQKPFRFASLAEQLKLVTHKS